MKLKEVVFSKKYPYAPYLNYELGVSVTPEDGETIEDCWNALEQKADEFHNKKGFHAQDYQKQSPEEITKNNVAEIESCTTLEQLETCRFLSLHGKEELEAYNKMKKKLTND